MKLKNKKSNTKQYDEWQACRESDHVPNAETIKAIEDPEFEKAENVDDLFKKLGI